jgi:hypothetical protein
VQCIALRRTALTRSETATMARVASQVNGRYAVSAMRGRGLVIVVVGIGTTVVSAGIARQPGNSSEGSEGPPGEGQPCICEPVNGFGSCDFAPTPTPPAVKWVCPPGLECTAQGQNGGGSCWPGGVAPSVPLRDAAGSVTWADGALPIFVDGANVLAGDADVDTKADAGDAGTD